MQALIALALVSGQIGAILGALGPILAALKDSNPGVAYGDALGSGTIGLLVAVYFAGSALGSVAHLMAVFRLQARNAVLLRDHLVAESQRQRSSPGGPSAAASSPTATDGAGSGVIAIDVAAPTTVVATSPRSPAAPPPRRAGPELEAQFMKSLESEVTLSSALIRWTLLLSLGLILGLYQLPRDLHGSGAAASFGVYLALLGVLGAFNGAQLSCVSTVVASWDVRGAERSIGLINLAFAAFAVAANWIHNALSRITATGADHGLPGAVYWAYVAALVAVVTLLCALTEFRRSPTPTIGGEDVAPASATSSAKTVAAGVTSDCHDTAVIPVPVSTASVVPSPPPPPAHSTPPHPHDTDDAAAAAAAGLRAAMARVEEKLTDAPAHTRRALSPLPPPPPSLPLRLVVVGPALGFRRVGHGPYTRHHMQSLTLKHFGVVVRLHGVHRPSLPVNAAGTAAATAAAAPAAAAVHPMAAAAGDRHQQQQQQRFWVVLCRSPAYWMLLLAMALSNGAFNVAGSWLNTLCDAQGLDADRTTLVSSLFWACTLVGRLVLALKATVDDTTTTPAAAAQQPRAQARNTLLVLLTFTTGAVLTLVGLSVGSGSFSGAVTFAVLTGLCVSVQFPLLSALEMQCQLFDDPSNHSNAIASAGLVIVSQIGALALPLLMSVASDAIGSVPTSYTIAVAAMAGALVALVVFAFTVRIGTTNKPAATSATATAAADAEATATPAPEERSLGASVLAECCTEWCCCGALATVPPRVLTTSGAIATTD